MKNSYDIFDTLCDIFHISEEEKAKIWKEADKEYNERYKNTNDSLKPTANVSKNKSEIRCTNNCYKDDKVESKVKSTSRTYPIKITDDVSQISETTFRLNKHAGSYMLSSAIDLIFESNKSISKENPIVPYITEQQLLTILLYKYNDTDKEKYELVKQILCK